MGKRLTALALLLLTLCRSASAQESPWAGLNGAELSARLDILFQQYATLGASAAVFENGEIVYTYCYGSRNAQGDPVTPECGFQVGSISKMVAAIGLMQLVEQGKADLEDELGGLLSFPIRSPYAPDAPVTLRQLMTHTAGLRDSGAYTDAVLGDVRPLSQLFSEKNRQNMFLVGYKPGERFHYSNFGGGLIGCLIEGITGQTLDQYMAANVFQPLGIAAAYQAALLPETMPLCDLYAMPSLRLRKKLRGDEAPVVQPNAEIDYTFSAGRLIVSAPDLCKLLIALCDGGVYQNARLLKESTAREMRTPQSGRGSVGDDGARGLFLNIVTDDLVAGRTLYGHGGKAYGMLCAAYFDPQDRTGVVMLTNGCRNNRLNGTVGMLSHLVLTELYAALESGAHQAVNPYQVE